MFTKQNIAIMILSVLLAASIIAILSFSASNKNVKQSLQACEKNLSEQNQKVAEITEAQIKQMKSTHDKLVSDLKGQIQKQEVTIKESQESLSLNFVDRILFEFGKADLTPEGEKILKKVGEALKNIKGKKIRVTGHTDNVPIRPDYVHKFPSNWELSAARAASVVRYFQEKPGLDPKDLEAVGRSFYHPEASNDTKEGRARNRSVEILIAPQMEVKGK
ncbi:MAG TPA: OmpA family protein [Thermodesulfobacteriota bacterium]|jgi:chemotaxis protein MotB|nr:OmpA family protein [Thermodesulfobacteriota bacterium]